VADGGMVDWGGPWAVKDGGSCVEDGGLWAAGCRAVEGGGSWTLEDGSWTVGGRSWTVGE